MVFSSITHAQRSSQEVPLSLLLRQCFCIPIMPMLYLNSDIRNSFILAWTKCITAALNLHNAGKQHHDLEYESFLANSRYIKVIYVRPSFCFPSGNIVKDAVETYFSTQGCKHSLTIIHSVLRVNQT